MKIAIDAQPTLKAKTGVGYYTFNLIKYLQKIDKKNQYNLILWKLFFKKKPRPTNIYSSNFCYKFIQFFPLRVYSKLFKLGVKIPLNIFLKTPDIMFFTNFVRYPILKSKTIIVIYDFSYLKYPNYGDAKNVKYLSKFVPKSINKAQHIVTISESSKRDIMKFYNVAEDKISIIYPAVDKDKFKPASKEEIDATREKYKIKGKYLFFTSTLEPRKNIEGIVSSYVSLPQEIKDEYSLVLAGGKGWQDENLLKQIERAKNEGESIVQTGYIPEEDLPSLYSGASLFLSPSFYEGFGIPILEAMACGVPVVTSNTSSMPEVAGEAAILVNPNDTNSIKEAIIKVLSDNNLKENMIRKGFNQIKKFSWEESAKKLVKVFERVYKEK